MLRLGLRAPLVARNYLQPSQFKNRFINLHPHDLEDYKKRFFHRKNLKASFKRMKWVYAFDVPR